MNFVTKDEISDDIDYELLGETPITLEDKMNIKIVTDGIATYSATSPTAWNFDDVDINDITFIRCEMSKENGYYEITSNSIPTEPTAWYQSYIEFLITGLKIGKSYKLIFDLTDRFNSDTQKVTYGTFTMWDSVSGGESLILSWGIRENERTIEFTPTTEVCRCRYYPAKNITPILGWTGNFTKMYINYADASEELTEIYNESGSFENDITLQSIPAKVTIISEPVATVYRKSPTDITLTKAGEPADAKVVGERLKTIKSYLPLYGRTIVNFGDSIFGNAQPPVDISTYLAEKTGATVYNCGFGGCRMSQHVSAWDAFSMYRLADSIANNNYTMQETALESTEVDLPDRFTPSVERLKSIDFSKVDIVTIAYGTNDFTSNIAMDNEENPFDTTTLAGALRYSVEKLLTAYPNIRIFVLSTAYRFWIDTENDNAFLYDSNTFTNTKNVKLLDYNAKLKEVAEEYNLPYVDDYNIGISKHNRSYYFSATDGAHHLETGRKLIASHLAGALTNAPNATPSKIELVNDVLNALPTWSGGAY